MRILWSCKIIKFVIILSAGSLLLSCFGCSSDSSDNNSLLYLNQLSGESQSDEFTTLNIASKDTSSTGAIAFDSIGHIHISYCDRSYNNNTGSYDYKLCYATNASGSWAIYTIDELYGESSAIAIDSNDKVHIIYSPPLTYATNVSGIWETSNIGSGSKCSIALDSNDRVHLSYGSSYSVHYLNNINGTWNGLQIDEIGTNGSYYVPICIDSHDNVHICYCVGYVDENNEDLKYATNVSGVWETFAVDKDENGSLGSCPSIAIDSHDGIHICYYHGNNNDMKYATNTSGIWETQVIDGLNYWEDLPWDVVSCSAIALDSNNNVHIVYSIFSDIIYATNVSGKWIIPAYDELLHRGRYYGCSLAINEYNKPFIVYSWSDSDIYWLKLSYIEYFILNISLVKPSCRKI